MSAPESPELLRARPALARPTAYSLALNFLPFGHVLAGIGLVVLVDGWMAQCLFGLAWLYLLPPLAGRAAIALFGMPEGEALTQQSRAYRVWWFLTQLQVIFNRFPALEEV